MHSTIIEGQSQNYGMEKESLKNTHNNQPNYTLIAFFALLNNVKMIKQQHIVAIFFVGCNDCLSNFF
jgi:hypothetical protein